MTHEDQVTVVTLYFNVPIPPPPKDSDQFAEILKAHEKDIR